MRALPAFLSLFLLVSPSMAVAHEFWIDTENFQVETDQQMEIDLRNGQEFKGVAQAFFPDNNTRFDWAMGDDITAVTGRLGDRPALQMTAPDVQGLLVILHEAAPSNLTYTKWEKFLKFAAHKDFPNAASDHKAAGWSMTRFGETYSRHSKALIAVGHGKGADQTYGLETEFIALTNPYDASFNNQMKVSLLYDSRPRSDAQVEVFERAPDGTVAITLHRTDDLGQATIPVLPGHDYLFDAVVLRPAPVIDDPKAPVWETLWAALSFHVPQ